MADLSATLEHTVLIRLEARGSKKDIERACVAVDDALKQSEAGIPRRLGWDLGVAMLGDGLAGVEVGLTVLAESSGQARVVGDQWLSVALEEGQIANWLRGTTSAGMRGAAL